MGAGPAPATGVRPPGRNVVEKHNDPEKQCRRWDGKHAAAPGDGRTPSAVSPWARLEARPEKYCHGIRASIVFNSRGSAGIWIARLAQW